MSNHLKPDKENTSMDWIGFIGLGKMGRPMPSNLSKAGFSLTVYDRDEKAVQELVRLGRKLPTRPRRSPSVLKSSGS